MGPPGLGTRDRIRLLAAATGPPEHQRPVRPRLHAPRAGIRPAHLSSCCTASGPEPSGCASSTRGTGCCSWGRSGAGFAPPRQGRRALLVGGGVGIAPLAILEDELRLLEGGAGLAAMLGFRDAEHAAGAVLLAGAQVATDDGSAGHHGPVTDLLADALRLQRHAEVYACGPPAMLEAMRILCAELGVPAQLALESGMACGFGACFGCVVHTREGYVRLCVDGPVIDAGRARQRVRGGRHRMTVSFCGIELEHPIINASGTFDAIAAQRAFGAELLERFPFAAFVSKTVTVSPRQGNPPPRLWETPCRHAQLDRAPEQGPGGLSGSGSADPGGPAGAADRQRHGLLRRGGRRARTARSANARRSPRSS